LFFGINEQYATSLKFSIQLLDNQRFIGAKNMKFWMENVTSTQILHETFLYIKLIKLGGIAKL
jgi:hypothetical protein